MSMTKRDPRLSKSRYRMGMLRCINSYLVPWLWIFKTCIHDQSFSWQRIYQFNKFSSIRLNISMVFLEVTLTGKFQEFPFIVWQSFWMHVQNFVINVFSTKNHGVRQVFLEHAYGLVEMKSAAILKFERLMELKKNLTFSKNAFQFYKRNCINLHVSFSSFL